METRFSFLTIEKIELARLEFSQLIISSSDDGDRFFELHCPGNTTSVVDRPFERFEDYEIFLKIIRDEDPEKYRLIHKGTPFYFLGWTAFDLKNYEKAVFYMDAAVSEDMRKNSVGWQTDPASQFLMLNPSGSQAAVRITQSLHDKTAAELSRFNAISGQFPITVVDVVDKFVKVLVARKEERSIVTAFYSFILEFEDRIKELSLRGIEGGSIEPILTYLFKGGLIFESLLKYLYPKRDGGVDNCKTLSDVFHTTAFNFDFNIDLRTRANTGADSLQEIIEAVGDDLFSAFSTISKIRNTAGHDLSWDDIFNEPNNLKILYEQQVNAILYLINRKFINFQRGS